MINKERIVALGWAAGIIAVSLAATYARRRGYVDGDVVNRIFLGFCGLIVAWYGNRMPKDFVPNVRARQAKRVGGWSMTLSGLVYAGLYAFAPLNLAFPLGCGAIVAGIAVTLGYCMSLRTGANGA